MRRNRIPFNKPVIALLLFIIGFAVIQFTLLYDQKAIDSLLQDDSNYLFKSEEVTNAMERLTKSEEVENADDDDDDDGTKDEDTEETVATNDDESQPDEQTLESPKTNATGDDDDDDKPQQDVETGKNKSTDDDDNDKAQPETSRKVADDDDNDDLRKKTMMESAAKTKHSNSGMNIVLLYADDWRYDSIGVVNPIVHTPNLDRLASQGMLFAQNAVTTSICWISRACLATGQHYARHRTLNISAPVPFFDHWNETLFGKLKDNGYYTGIVGKWHAAPFPPQSFNFNNLYYGFHIDASGKHITDMNEEHALQFLEAAQNQDDPFALFVNFFAPHHHDGQKEQYFPSNATMSLYQDIVIPFAPTATQEAWEALPSFFNDNNEGRIRWRARFDTPDKAQKMMKNYYRLISGVDKTCGKIIEQLEKQNLMNNTLVIFTTDNGYYHAEHGLADKFYAHQESIRVPLIIKDPRMDKKKIGSQNEDFTLSIDLAPTMLKAAGIDIPDRMQGVDMSPLYTPNEESYWRNQFYYEYPGIPDNSAHIRVQALVRKDYKYMFWPDEDYEQLYHIPTDRYEEHDLARNFTYKAKLEEMRKAFKVEQSIAQ